MCNESIIIGSRPQRGQVKAAGRAKEAKAAKESDEMTPYPVNYVIETRHVPIIRSIGTRAAL